MRLFGLEFRSPIARAAAPAMPTTTISAPSPPFGSNVPPLPSRKGVASLGLAERAVPSDPRDLWYLALPTKLSPKQVIQILRAALGGDLWQQWQLYSLMLDSWPMFRKCSHEVRQAVSQCRFIVHPYAEEGEEPTPEAKDRASLVRRAMASFRPNPFSDERGWQGMVYNVTDQVLNGISMTETMWKDPVRAPGGGWEIMPRASAWVHPRNYTFGTDGNIAIFMPGLYQNLSFNAKTPEPTNPDKFICAQFMGRSGSSLGAGLVRPLAQDWVAFIWGQGWLLPFAQKWGNPFLDVKYKPGTPPEEVDKLEQYVAQGAAQGYIVHVDGSEVNPHFPPAMTGNALLEMKKVADEHCQLLLLGQTATTQGTPGKLGAEDAQMQVKTEMVQGCANQTAVTLEQFVLSVIRLNYGEDPGEETLVPTIAADFSEETDPATQAQRDQIFLQAGVPMVREEFYKANNMRMPMAGEDVIVSGKLGKLADTEQELGGQPEPPPGFGEGEEADPNDIENVAAVARASDEEYEALARKIKAAKAASAAGHVNGEWEEVKVAVKELKARYA